jgi:dTDP-4-dehydrorhamnose reductase
LDKRILVLGKNGQLGQEIISFFKKKNIKIISLNSSQCNLENKNFINKLKKIKVNIIINCAAYTKVDLAEIKKKKCNRINNIAVGKIAQFCNKNKITFFHFSTDYVFGNMSKPITENSKKNPINFYGKTKLLGERKIINSKCNYIIIRTSGVYSNQSENFPNKIIELIKKKNELNVIDNQYMSPTSVKTISKVVYLLLKKKCIKQIYHVSDREKTTWYKVANFIKKKIPKKRNIKCKLKKINSSKFKTLAERPLFSYLDCTKIEKELSLKLPNWKIQMEKQIKYIIKKK